MYYCIEAVHADSSLTQVGERQMSNAEADCASLSLVRAALSLALQALNGTPQSEKGDKGLDLGPPRWPSVATWAPNSIMNIMESSQKNQSYRHCSASRKAEVEMGGAHSSEKDRRWGSKVLEWRPGTGKRSVGRPQRGGQTTANKSLRAAGSKRPRTPYKRPMSNGLNTNTNQYLCF
ncbi:jg4472 [Pararge aegeria aegeria]|uniref:Jg4472 protein n=1 Tax=Pararge aegeria aegeria TaxID=348720 RepID=A0A8S4SLG8_9NEOP|nr:jg4472 [Pararge aegeria aegeria]